MAEHHHHTTLYHGDPERYAVSRRVTWVSVVVNLVLTVVQFIIGAIGNSQALVADSIHTLSDLFTDFMVLIALFHSKKAADAEHPYGHERIETATTLLLGVMLFAVGAGIIVRAGLRLMDVEAPPTPDLITLWAALFTLAAKEGLFRYLLRVADRFNSDMLRANAWHSRSDAVSSLVVVAGIGGSLIGFPYLDAVAAVIVAFMIIKVAFDLGWPALQELVDTGLDDATVQRIRRTILGVDGVKTLHMLRTRRAGGRALVDVHILVDETLSVSEGHQIGEAVRNRLIGEIDEVIDVMVHIDTEDDAEGNLSAALPLRQEVIARLRAAFAPLGDLPPFERITLHYIRGALHITILLPLTAFRDIGAAQAARARMQQAVRGDPQIAALEVNFY
jgi:cation diffusion facilitator family transporter